MHLPRLACCLPGLALAMAACQSKTAETAAAKDSAATAVTLLTPGPWRGELAMQEQTIPFLFEVKMEAGKPVLYLINKGLDGEQRLRCPKITQAGDSVTVRMPTADAALVLRADGPGKLKGAWVKYDGQEPYPVPVKAMNEKEYAMATTNEPLEPEHFDSFDGTWSVAFKDKTNKTYQAVGLFKSDTTNWKYTGAFLTSIEDYKYLTGYASGQTLFMSTFDGNHAFLFIGTTPTPKYIGIEPVVVIRGPLTGDFYSGNSRHETFTAVRDPNARLPAARTLR